MTRIVRKFSFCFLHFQWWFKFMGKVFIWLKHFTFIKKLPISKVQSFLKLNFWPKSNIQNSAYVKRLNWELQCNRLALYFYWNSEKCFGVIKTLKKWSWKGTGVSKDKKFACSDNPGHNIWNKVKSSSKTGKEKKSLVSVFTLF